MNLVTDKYYLKTKRNHLGYRFSWEIFTDIILENVARKPYWLDIGAGPNILIDEQRGSEFAVGLDIEKPERIAIPPDSAYCIAQSELLPFKERCFDYVTSRYTFEHLREPHITMREVARVLKPGGVFALQTSNKNNPFILLSRMIPFALKKRIYPYLFKDNPSGTFKTHYKMNTPRALPVAIDCLKLQKLIMVEDLLRHNAVLFFLSDLIYRIMTILKLENLYGNMIALYKKN